MHDGTTFGGEFLDQDPAVLVHRGGTPESAGLVLSWHYIPGGGWIGTWDYP